MQACRVLPKACLLEGAANVNIALPPQLTMPQQWCVFLGTTLRLLCVTISLDPRALHPLHQMCTTSAFSQWDWECSCHVTKSQWAPSLAEQLCWCILHFQKGMQETKPRTTSCSVTAFVAGSTALGLDLGSAGCGDNLY